MKCDSVMRRSLPVPPVMIGVTSVALMKVSQRSRSREKGQRSDLDACNCGLTDSALHNA